MSGDGLFKLCLILAGLSRFAAGGEDSTGMHLKYIYISAPKYSLDGVDFKRTRNEFSFKSFYPEFKEIYGSKYGFEPLQTAERQHLWATLIGIPGGALLGLGIAEFLFRSDEGGFRKGGILTLAASPLLFLSVKWDLDSYRTLKAGIK